MNSEKEQWFVLVVSEGGRLVPTPEHMAPKNTKYLDEDGVIRDYRALSAANVPRVEIIKPQGLTEAEKRIKYLLENRKAVLAEYYQLLIRGEDPEDLEALTIQAVDYSRPSVQVPHGGEAAQNLMVSLLDNGQIAKEQARQRADLRQAIEAAREQADEVRLLDELIMRLPYRYRGILQDTYYFYFSKADLKELYKSNYPKRRDAAIRELAGQYKADARRLAP